MNIGTDHSGSGSSEDLVQIAPRRIGGGDEGSHTDQHFQLEWDSYADAGYDTNPNTHDFRWTRESDRAPSLVSNAPGSSRFMGTFSNDNEDEFHSLASTEYLSVDEDVSPTLKSENQRVQLTFPKMALKLNLDVTVSDVDPATGKLELRCFAGNGTDNDTRLGRNENIAHCEMWLNEQYLQQHTIRSSSSDIDMISYGPLFSESDEWCSENLKSSSDSKLSCETKTTYTQNGISMESLQGRLTDVQKNYRLINFSDEEESLYWNRQITESANALDRLIAWYNNGCSSSFVPRESEPIWECAGSVNKGPFAEEKSKALQHLFAHPELEDDMPDLPSLPSSPSSSRDSLEESCDSLSDSNATTSGDNTVPLNDSRPSWLTIYTSSTQFEPGNEYAELNSSNLPESSSSSRDDSGQSSQLVGLQQAYDTAEIRQSHVDDNLSESDEWATNSFSFGIHSESTCCAKVTSIPIHSHTSNDIPTNNISEEELYAQTQSDKMKNNSSSTLFDSAFESMLQGASADIVSYTNNLPPRDTSDIGDVATRRADDKQRHVNDSRLTRTEEGVFQLSQEFTLPSDGNMSSCSRLSDLTSGSQLSNDIETTTSDDTPLSISGSEVPSEGIIAEESRCETSSENRQRVSSSCVADFTLSDIFNENMEQNAAVGDITETQQSTYTKTGFGDNEEDSLFLLQLLSSDEKSKLSTDFVADDHAENEMKRNEEKLRVLAISYGLLDDTEELDDYDSYDSDDSEVSGDTREDKSKSLSLSDYTFNDDTDSSLIAGVDALVIDGPVNNDMNPDGNDTSGQTSSATSACTTDQGDLSGPTSSTNTFDVLMRNSENSTTSSSMYDILGPSVWQAKTGNQCSADEIQERLIEHKKSRIFHSEDTIFNFSDQDQVDFLGKFQRYVESLDIGVCNSATCSQSNDIALQGADDEGYFSCFDEDKVKECNIRKFLGNHIDPTKTANGESLDVNHLADSDDLLNNIARKLAARIISDISLCQENSNETIQSVSDATVANGYTSDPLQMLSSNESLKTHNEKHLLSTQDSGQNVRPTPSDVFTCPYFDDISRLDLFQSSVEDIGKWPVSTFSVSDLASRSHSQIIDILNSEKHVELIAYSLDVYQSDDEDDEVPISAIVSEQSLISGLRAEQSVIVDQKTEESSTSDYTTDESSICDHTTQQGGDSDQTTEQSCVCGMKADIRAREAEIMRIPSDRYSFSVKDGTFLQHNDYDTARRDTSRATTMAAVEHESLAHYACLLVKDVISAAQKKFVWSMEGHHEKENTNYISPSSESDSSRSAQRVVSSKSQHTDQVNTSRNIANSDKQTCARSNKERLDNKSSVLLTSPTDDTQKSSSLDYCRTVVAVGLSSIAIRQGMNELRLVAIKEWQRRRRTSTTSKVEQSATATTSSESEPEVDKYTKYKSKLRELKIQRQRGGSNRTRIQERKTSIPVEKKSVFYQTESSSDASSDDDSSLDDDDMDECDRNMLAALYRENDQNTNLKIENILSTEMMLLKARQAHHLRRLERYRSKAERTGPSELCPHHNGIIPPSRPIPNNCWCNVEKAEAMRNMTFELLRGGELDKTEKCLLRMEGEYRAMRMRLDARESAKCLALRPGNDLAEQEKVKMQTETEKLKASLYKYLEDMGSALKENELLVSGDLEGADHHTQDPQGSDRISNPDMDLFTNTLNTVWDGIEEQVKKDFDDTVKQEGTERSVQINLEEFGHQEGTKQPVIKDFEVSGVPEKENPDDEFLEESTKLARIAVRAFKLEMSREFLTEEYKQLKDNRLGVDLTPLVPAELIPTEVDLPPLVTPRCSMCKLRKKVNNRVNTVEADKKSQTTDRGETKTDAFATVKRFGGHEYDVVTGCGIRKHKVTCALCKTREDVGV